MQASEYQIQCSIVQYLHILNPPAAWFHIPNGEYRSKQTGARLKRMGVKPGCPDLFLAMPNQHFAGLWVELKSKKGSPSAVQKDFMQKLLLSGYAVVVIRSVEEFIRCFEAYANMVDDECRLNWLQNWQIASRTLTKKDVSKPAVKKLFSEDQPNMTRPSMMR